MIDQEFISQSQLFFIIGRGRSGTTLLRLMLNAHPNLSVAPEALFIMNLYKKYGGVKDWDRQTLGSFYDDLWLEKRFDDWYLDKTSLKQMLLTRKRNSSFAELCKIIYAHYAVVQGKKEVSLFGDKNPHYCLFLKELINIFPDSKFIHVVRDHRDNILSYQKVRFDVQGTCALAYRWKKYNEEILKYCQKYPDRFIFLRFEDFVVKPDHYLERICHFLGVSFDPIMLHFLKNYPELAYEWHRNLIKPPDKNRIYVWKREMKASDLLRSDYICRNLSQVFEYEISYQQNSVMLSILTLPGLLVGWLYTCLEKVMFYLPLKLRVNIITYYRILTGSLARN